MSSIYFKKFYKGFLSISVSYSRKHKLELIGLPKLSQESVCIFTIFSTLVNKKQFRVLPRGGRGAEKLYHETVQIFMFTFISW